MKRGFTLVELLVVISIIAVLASMALANIESARSQARDSQRSEQIRQVDLATRLYIETNGHAPYLMTGCEVQSNGTFPDIDAASGCFAVSTDGVGEPGAWSAFLSQIGMDVPGDPCSSCGSGSDFPLGYTYVAPLAMQYFCGTDCPYSANELNRSYQLYAPLERSRNPSGSSGSGGGGSGPGFGDFNSPHYDPPAFVSISVPIHQIGNNYDIGITYNIVGANSCTVSDSLGYVTPVSLAIPQGFRRITTPVLDENGFHAADTLIITCSGIGGTLRYTRVIEIGSIYM